MVTGDVDGDGRDEILLGSCMLDDNGTLLWSSGLGHSDKAYLCKLRPDEEDLQVFMVSEPKKEDGRGVSVVNARTGQLIWGIGHATYHVGMAWWRILIRNIPVWNVLPVKTVKVEVWINIC